MDEGNPNTQMTEEATRDIPSSGFRHSFAIRHSSFVIRPAFHSIANRSAAVFLKLLFGCVARVRVLRRENADCEGSFLLAANHISHFDPFILSSVVRRKIDWMAMAEFFPYPVLGSLLRAVDAFPADRHRADRRTILAAIERLKNGRIVGVFPEGGIRDGSCSILEGAPLRPGAATLAHIAGTPVLPCVIVGSDRLYAKKSWLPLRSTPIWIAFGDLVQPFPELEKLTARARIEQELSAAFKNLYAELRRTFALTAEDLPHPPRQRMAERMHTIRRSSAVAIDTLMCASINLLQARHRLHARSRDEMEQYVAQCETLTVHDYYGVPGNADIAHAIGNGAAVTWRSPIESRFPANNVARADFFLSARGWSAPTVLMLHALMSASHMGYRRWAKRLNELGWNACFVHLPYHYSRVPRGYWNGELAITADLIRNAEGLRQGVIEVRQLIGALRAHGCRKIGVLGTSYGGWIGALLATVERDLHFVALMAPIVNVAHAIWESPASAFMRRELRRTMIEPSLVARHFHLSSPMHNKPMCDADRVLFVSGEFDLIARSTDIEKIHQEWHGSELLRVRQGHFGYRMLRETVARLKQHAL
jgi:1-acyl-sn-glycerol-3-phosphate acyltransferase